MLHFVYMSPKKQPFHIWQLIFSRLSHADLIEIDEITRCLFKSVGILYHALYWESSLFTTELQFTDNWKEIKFMHPFKFAGFPEYWQGHH